MAEIGEKFRPGEKVPDPGIYDVVHDQHHRPNHQVTCSERQAFPPCQSCGSAVRFELAIKVPSVSDDSDFDSNLPEEDRVLRPAS